MGSLIRGSHTVRKSSFTFHDNYRRLRRGCYHQDSLNNRPVNIQDWPRTLEPSPHGVLGIRLGDPYSSDQFNKLVKLYHPDLRNHSPGPETAALSQEVLLERFRLILAAKGILSDPKKRSMYEDYGVGWPPRTTHHSPAPGADARNDTRQTETKDSCSIQQPLYMPNIVLAALFIFMASVVAAYRFKAARSESLRRQQRMINLSDRVLGELGSAEYQLSGQGRDERVTVFLMHRGMALSRLNGDEGGNLPGSAMNNEFLGPQVTSANGFLDSNLNICHR